MAWAWTAVTPALPFQPPCLAEGRTTPMVILRQTLKVRCRCGLEGEEERS